MFPTFRISLKEYGISDFFSFKQNFPHFHKIQMFCNKKTQSCTIVLVLCIFDNREKHQETRPHQLKSNKTICGNTQNKIENRKI